MANTPETSKIDTMFAPPAKYDYFSYFLNSSGTTSIDRANADLFQHINKNPQTELFLPTLEQVKKGAKQKAESEGLPFNEKAITELWQQANNGYKKYSNSEFSANNVSLAIPDSYFNRKNGFDVTVSNIDKRPTSIEGTGLEWRNNKAVEDGSTPYETVVKSEFDRDTDSGLYAKVEDYYEMAKKNATKQRKRGVYDEKTGDLKYNEDGTPVLEDFHPEDLGWGTARTYRFDKNTGQPILVPLDKGEDARKVINKKSAWGVSDFDSVAGGMFDVPLDMTADAISGLSKATGYVIDNLPFIGDGFEAAAWDNKGTSQSKLGKAFTDFGYNIQSNKNLDQQGGAFDSFANFTGAYSGFMASFIPQVALTAVNPLLGLGYAGATTAEGMYETALQSGFSERESAVIGSAMGVAATTLSKVLSGDWMNRITKSINPKWMQEKVFKKVVDDSLKAKDLYAKQLGRELTEQESAKIIADTTTKSAASILSKLNEVVKIAKNKWKNIPESAWVAKTAQQGIDEAVEETTEELIQEGLQTVYRDYVFDNSIYKNVAYKKFDAIFDNFTPENEREERFVKSMSDGSNAFSKKSWKEIFENAADTFGISAIGTGTTTAYRNYKIAQRDKGVEKQDNAIIDYILENPNGKKDILKTGELLKQKGVLGNNRYTTTGDLATQEDKTDTENYINYKTSKDKIEAYYDLYEKTGIKEALDKKTITTDQAKQFLNEAGNSSNPQGAALYNFAQLKRTEEKIKNFQGVENEITPEDINLFNKSFEERQKEIESKVLGKSIEDITTSEKQQLDDIAADKEILKSNNIEATILKSGYGKLYKLQKEKQQLEQELQTIDAENNVEKANVIEERLTNIDKNIESVRNEVSLKYATQPNTQKKLSDIANLLLEKQQLDFKVKDIYNGNLLKNQITQGFIFSKMSPERLKENYKGTDGWESIVDLIKTNQEIAWAKENLLSKNPNAWEKIDAKKLSQFNYKRKKAIGEYKLSSKQKELLKTQANDELQAFKVEGKTTDDIIAETNLVLEKLLTTDSDIANRQLFVEKLNKYKNDVEQNIETQAVADGYDGDDFINEYKRDEKFADLYSEVDKLDKLQTLLDTISKIKDSVSQEVDPELFGSIQYNGKADNNVAGGLSDIINKYYNEAIAKSSSIEFLADAEIKSWEMAIAQNRFMANLNLELSNVLLQESKIQDKATLREITPESVNAIFEKLTQLQSNIDFIKSIKQDLGKNRFKEDDDIRIETIKNKISHVDNSVLGTLIKLLDIRKKDAKRVVFENDTDDIKLSATITKIQELKGEIETLLALPQLGTSGLKALTVAYTNLENQIYDSFTQSEIQNLYVEILNQYRELYAEKGLADINTKTFWGVFVKAMSSENVSAIPPLLRAFSTLDTIFNYPTVEFYKAYSKEYINGTTDMFLPSLEQELVLKQIYGFLNATQDNYGKFRDNFETDVTKKKFDTSWNSNILFVSGMAGAGKTHMITKAILLQKVNNVVLSAPAKTQIDNLKSAVDKLKVPNTTLSLSEIVVELNKNNTELFSSNLLIVDEGTIADVSAIEKLNAAIINYNKSKETKLKVLVLGDSTQLIGKNANGERKTQYHPFIQNTELKKPYTDELQQTYRTSYLTFNILQQALIGAIKLGTRNTKNNLPAANNGISYYLSLENLNDSAGVQYQKKDEQVKQFLNHIEQIVAADINSLKDIMYIVSDLKDTDTQNLISQIASKFPEDIANQIVINNIKTVDDSQGTQRKYVYANVTEGLLNPTTGTYMRAVRVASTRAIEFVSIAVNDGTESLRVNAKTELYKYADENSNDIEPTRKAELIKKRKERNTFVKDVVNTIAGIESTIKEDVEPEQTQTKQPQEEENQKEDVNYSEQIKEKVQETNLNGGKTVKETTEKLEALKEIAKQEDLPKADIQIIDDIKTKIEQEGNPTIDVISVDYSSIINGEITEQVILENFTPTEDGKFLMTNLVINYGEERSVEYVVNVDENAKEIRFRDSNDKLLSVSDVLSVINEKIGNNVKTNKPNYNVVFSLPVNVDVAQKTIQSSIITNELQEKITEVSDKIIEKSKEIIELEEQVENITTEELNNIVKNVVKEVETISSEATTLSYTNDLEKDVLYNKVKVLEQEVQSLKDKLQERFEVISSANPLSKEVDIIDIITRASLEEDVAITIDIEVEGTKYEDGKTENEKIPLKLENKEGRSTAEYLKEVIDKIKAVYKEYARRIALSNSNALVHNFLTQNALLFHSHALSEEYVNNILETLEGEFKTEQEALRIATKSKNSFINKLYNKSSGEEKFTINTKLFEGIEIGDKTYTGQGSFKLTYKAEHKGKIVYDNESVTSGLFDKDVFVIEYIEKDLPPFELGVLRKNKKANASIFNDDSVQRIINSAEYVGNDVVKNNFTKLQETLNLAKGNKEIIFTELKIKSFKNTPYSSESNGETKRSLTEYREFLKGKNYGYTKLYQIKAGQTSELRIPDTDFKYGSGKGDGKGLAGATVMFIGHGISNQELEKLVDNIDPTGKADLKLVQENLNKLFQQKNITMVIMDKKPLKFKHYLDISKTIVKRITSSDIFEPITIFNPEFDTVESIFNYFQYKNVPTKNPDKEYKKIFALKENYETYSKDKDENLVDSSFFSAYQALQTESIKNQVQATKLNVFGLVNKLFNIFTKNNLSGDLPAIFQVGGHVLHFTDGKKVNGKTILELSDGKLSQERVDEIAKNNPSYGTLLYTQDLYKINPEAIIDKNGNRKITEEEELHLTVIFNDFVTRREKRDDEGNIIGYYGETDPKSESKFKKDFVPDYRYDLFYYLETILGKDEKGGSNAEILWGQDDVTVKNYEGNGNGKSGKITNSIALRKKVSHPRPFVDIEWQNEIGEVIGEIYETKNESKPYPTFLVDVNSLVPKETIKAQTVKQVQPKEKKYVDEIKKTDIVLTEAVIVDNSELIKNLTNELNELNSLPKVFGTAKNQRLASINKLKRQIDNLQNGRPIDAENINELNENNDIGGSSFGDLKVAANPLFITNRKEVTNRLRNLFGNTSLEINFDNEILNDLLAKGVITQSQYNFHSNPDKVLGYTYKNLIALNEKNGLIDATTASHEAVHFVLKLVTPSFRKNVINEARVRFKMTNATEKEIEEKLAQWYEKAYPTYQESKSSILRGLPLFIRRLFVGMREMYLNLRKSFLNDSNYVNELFSNLESGVYRDFEIKDFNDNVIDTALNNKGKKIKAYQSLYKVFSGDGTNNEINLESINAQIRRDLYKLQFGLSKFLPNTLDESINKLKKIKQENYKKLIDNLKLDIKETEEFKDLSDEELTLKAVQELDLYNINSDYKQESEDAALHKLFKVVDVELVENETTSIVPFDAIVEYNYPNIGKAKNESLYSDNDENSADNSEANVKGKEFHLLDKNVESKESDILIQHLVNTPLYIKEQVGDGKNVRTVWKKTANKYVDLAQSKKILKEVFKNARLNSATIDPTYSDIIKSFKEMINNTTFNKNSSAFSLFVKFFADKDFITDTFNNSQPLRDSHSFYSVVVENSLMLEEDMSSDISDYYKDKLANALSELYSFYGSVVKRAAIDIDIQKGISIGGVDSTAFADLKAISKGKMIATLYDVASKYVPTKKKIKEFEKSNIKIVTQTENIAGVTLQSHFLTYEGKKILKLNIADISTKTNIEVADDIKSIQYNYTIQSSFVSEALADANIGVKVKDLLDKIGINLPSQLLSEAMKQKNSNYLNAISKVIGFTYTQYIADLNNEYGNEANKLYTNTDFIQDVRLTTLIEDVAQSANITEINTTDNNNIRRSPLINYRDIEVLASLYEHIIPKIDKESVYTSDNAVKNLNLDNNNQHKLLSTIFKIKNRLLDRDVANVIEDQTNLKVINNELYKNPLLTGEIDFDDNSLIELNTIENSETKEKLDLVDASVFEQAKIYVEELFIKPLIESNGHFYYSQTTPKSDKATQFVKRIASKKRGGLLHKLQIANSIDSSGNVVKIVNNAPEIKEKLKGHVESNINYFYNQFLPRVKDLGRLLVLEKQDVRLYKAVETLESVKGQILNQDTLNSLDALLKEIGNTYPKLVAKSAVKIGFDVSKKYGLSDNIKSIFTANTLDGLVNNEFNKMTKQILKDAEEMVKSGYSFIDVDLVEKLIKSKLYNSTDFTELAAFSKNALNKIVGYNTKRIVKTLSNNGVISTSANKGVIEYVGRWTREEVANQTDKVFLFGDNTDDRINTKYVPKQTQAVIRELPNAIGIDTKKDRGTMSSSYFTDADFTQFKQQVDSAIQQAKNSEKIIVIPADGIGTGKAMLKQKAPKLFTYLQEELNKLKAETVESQKSFANNSNIIGEEIVFNPIILDFLTSSYINSYYIDELYYGHSFNYKDIVEQIKRAIFLSTNYKTPDLNNPNGLPIFSNIVTIEEPLIIDNIYGQADRYKQIDKKNNVTTIPKSTAPTQVKTIVEELTGVKISKENGNDTKILDGLGFSTVLHDNLEQKSYGEKFTDKSQRKNIAGGLFSPKLIKNSYSKLTNELMELSNEYLTNYVNKTLGGIGSPLYNKWIEFDKDWDILTEWFNTVEEDGIKNRNRIAVEGSSITIEDVTIDTPAKTYEDLHTGLIIFPSSSKISPNKINNEFDTNWNTDKQDNRLGGFVISLYQNADNADIAMITQENYIFSLLGNNYQTTQEIYDLIGNLAEEGLITLDEKSGTFMLPQNKESQEKNKNVSKEKWFKSKLADILRNMGNISNTLLFATNDVDSSHPLIRNSMYGAIASAIKSFTVKQRFKGFRGTVTNATGLVNMYNVTNDKGVTIRMSKKQLLKDKIATVNEQGLLTINNKYKVEVDELAFTRLYKTSDNTLVEGKELVKFITNLKNYETNAKAKAYVDNVKNTYRVEPMEIMISRKALSQFRIPKNVNFNEANNLEYFLKRKINNVYSKEFTLDIVEDLLISEDVELNTAGKLLNEYLFTNPVEILKDSDLKKVLTNSQINKIKAQFISFEGLSLNNQNKISEKLNIPKESITSELIIQWANEEALEEFKLWKKATQPKLTRIPVTGYNSVQMAKVVEFYDSQENTVLVPSELSTIAGSDCDGDMVTLEFYDVDKKDTPERNIRRQLYDVKRKALLDPFNIRTLFSPISFDKLKERKEQLVKKQENAYKMTFNSPVSKMIVQKNNNDGKAGVGIFVKLAEVYYNMYRIAKTLKESGVVDADKFNQPIYFNGRAYDSILGGAVSKEGQTIDGYTSTVSSYPTSKNDLIQELQNDETLSPETKIDYINKVNTQQPIAGFRLQNGEYYKEELILVNKILENYSNASLDNAKEALLGWLNVNEKTWNLFGGAIVAQIDEEDMTNLMTHPYTLSLIKTLNSENAIYSNKDKKSTLNSILKRRLFMSNKDFKNKLEGEEDTEALAESWKINLVTKEQQKELRKSGGENNQVEFDTLQFYFESKKDKTIDLTKPLEKILDTDSDEIKAQKQASNQEIKKYVYASLFMINELGDEVNKVNSILRVLGGTSGNEYNNQKLIDLIIDNLGYYDPKMSKEDMLKLLEKDLLDDTISFDNKIKFLAKDKSKLISPKKLVMFNNFLKQSIKAVIYDYRVKNDMFIHKLPEVEKTFNEIRKAFDTDKTKFNTEGAYKSLEKEFDKFLIAKFLENNGKITESVEGYPTLDAINKLDLKNINDRYLFIKFLPKFLEEIKSGDNKLKNDSFITQNIIEDSSDNLVTLELSNATALTAEAKNLINVKFNNLDSYGDLGKVFKKLLFYQTLITKAHNLGKGSFAETMSVDVNNDYSKFLTKTTQTYKLNKAGLQSDLKLFKNQYYIFNSDKSFSAFQSKTNAEGTTKIVKMKSLTSVNEIPTKVTKATVKNDLYKGYQERFEENTPKYINLRFVVPSPQNATKKEITHVLYKLNSEGTEYNRIYSAYLKSINSYTINGEIPVSLYPVYQTIDFNESTDLDGVANKIEEIESYATKNELTTDAALMFTGGKRYNIVPKAQRPVDIEKLTDLAILTTFCKN